MFGVCVHCRWRAGVLITLLALPGCADSRSPTDPQLTPQFALGEVFTVMNTNDDGPGSLRQTLIDATADATIRFAPSLAGAMILLESQLTVPPGLTIEGPASGGITLSGGHQHRVLLVPPSPSTLTLRNLTITHGLAAVGGGISSGTALIIEHSTIADNIATGLGAHGGGIESGADVTLVNSTVSGNTADDLGGGISSAAGVSLINSTVANNTVLLIGGDSLGGGVASQTLLLHNSIVAGNTPGDCSGQPMTLVGRNYVTTDACGILGPGLVVADPMIGPLASNGGPSQTHALLRGSPAIDAALLCTVAVDQRHIARPQGAACDIGAHEFDAYAKINLVVDASVSVNPKNGVAVVTGSLQCSEDTSFDLDVGLEQPQKAGRVRTMVQATHTQSIACSTGLRHWSAALMPPAGGFRNGAATADAGTANTDSWVISAAVARPVKLFWGHK